MECTAFVFLIYEDTHTSGDCPNGENMGRYTMAQTIRQVLVLAFPIEGKLIQAISQTFRYISIYTSMYL